MPKPSERLSYPAHFRDTLQNFVVDNGFVQRVVHPVTGEAKTICVLPRSIQFLDPSLGRAAVRYHGGSMTENLSKILGMPVYIEKNKYQNPSLMASAIYELAKEKGWIRTVEHPVTSEKQTIAIISDFSNNLRPFQTMLSSHHGGASVETISKLLGMPVILHQNRLANPLIFAREFYDTASQNGWLQTLTHPATGQQITAVILPKHFNREGGILSKNATQYHGGSAVENVSHILGIPVFNDYEKLQNPIVFATHLKEEAEQRGWIQSIPHPKTGKPLNILVCPPSPELIADFSAAHHHGGLTAKNLANVLGLDMGVHTGNHWKENVPSELQPTIQPIVEAHRIAADKTGPVPVRRAIIQLAGFSMDYSPLLRHFLGGMQLSERFESTPSPPSRAILETHVEKNPAPNSAQQLRMAMDPNHVNWAALAQAYHDHYSTLSQFVTANAGALWLAENLNHHGLAMPPRVLSMGAGTSNFYETLQNLKPRLNQMGVVLPQVVDLENNSVMRNAGTNPVQLDHDITQPFPVVRGNAGGIEFSNFSAMKPTDIKRALHNASNALKEEQWGFVESLVETLSTG